MFTARISRATTLLRRFATKPEDIGEMIKKNKVVVFMKGVPEEPKCGFSNAVVQIMRMHGVQYDAHDVLKDDSLRQNIKDFSNWPTIPQVFINGEFVGGCDILLQMHQNGELIEELKKVGIDSALLTKEAEKDKEKEALDQAGNPVIETTENNNPNSPEIEKVIDKNQEFQKMTDNNQEILEMIDRRLNKELWALKTKLERAEMRLQENDIKYRALKSEMIEMQGEWLKYKTLQELEILNRNSQSKAIDTQSEALNRIK